MESSVILIWLFFANAFHFDFFWGEGGMQIFKSKNEVSSASVSRKSLSLGLLKNRKVNKKPYSIYEGTSETQSSFSYNQWLSESRSIFYFKVKIKSMAANQIVFDHLRMVGKINWGFKTHILWAWIS